MIVHRLQALALRFGIRLVRALGPVTASNAVGRVLRTLGPFFAASRVADANLQLAMPHLTAEQRAEIVRGVWENFGRTAAELPHLAGLRRTAEGPGWELEGEEHLQAIREKGGPAIFFSAHIANWELIGPAAAEFGVAVAGIYRAASNPLADAIIQDLRREARAGDVAMFAKGSAGAREAMAHLKRGGMLGMMVDQKMNDGIPVAFFGRDAMTAPALAHLAGRFRCPVLPIHTVRLGPARFRVVCEAPLDWRDTGNRNADAAAFTLRINHVLEGWIRFQPEAWLWLHRRWPEAP